MFGFSACLNVAALIVASTQTPNRDYGPSIFLFVYVGWVVWVIIWSIQARWFPAPTNEASVYEFLRHPNPEQRLQISMTMRTELMLRGLDLMSDVVFFWDGMSASYIRSCAQMSTRERADPALFPFCPVVRKAEAEDESSPEFFFGWSPAGKFVTAIFAT
jgi:hypothetical protein